MRQRENRERQGKPLPLFVIVEEIMQKISPEQFDFHLDAMYNYLS